MSALIEVRGLERRFRLPTHFLQRDKPVLHALRGVDVTIERGVMLEEEVKDGDIYLVPKVGFLE